jgi:hypothetical protein
VPIEIQKVTGDRKGMARFRRLPWDINKDDPLWAPDLILDLKKRLNVKTHPFFEYGSADFFLAVRDGNVVGRIAAIENPKHNEYHNDRTGFWGFFECVNDQKVADALFDAARTWVGDRGLTVLRGPMSCDTQDEVGTLIEGFDTQRYFIMPHNPPYYNELCSNYGMAKAKDLVAFHIDLTTPVPEREARLAELVKERMLKKGYTIRNLDKKNLKRDFKVIMDIYQAAWADNWGFAPMTEKEFNTIAETMGLVAVEDFVIIIESPKGEPVAMAVALYDWMECTRWARKFPYALQGPMQLLHLLWRLFLKREPKFKRARLFFAGVMPGHRAMGLDALLYVLPFQAGKKHGLVEGELSWELEDNVAIIKPIEKLGGRVYKKMRIWDTAV